MPNNGIVMLCARLLLTICAESCSILYFILSELEMSESEISSNPLLFNICYVQPIYFIITVVAYLIFLCFEKLEET